MIKYHRQPCDFTMACDLGGLARVSGSQCNWHCQSSSKGWTGEQEGKADRELHVSKSRIFHTTVKQKHQQQFEKGVTTLNMPLSSNYQRDLTPWDLHQGYHEGSWVPGDQRNKRSQICLAFHHLPRNQGENRGRRSTGTLTCLRTLPTPISW